jgi:methionyl-tRNA formyltransferase
MRLVMMGTGTFAEPTFRALLASSHPVVGLVTQPERATGQERGSTRQTGEGMAAIARSHQVAVFQPENVNTTEGVAGVKAFQPDLLVVAAYGQILSRELLAAVPRGGINVHASLLPKYRGAAPVAWAIYHGETRTGVTIIKMSAALDAGDILAQEALDIGPEETAGELEARLASVGARLALQVGEQISNGTAKGTPQDKSQATRAPKLTKEHGLIDWSRTAEQIGQHIRAMQPWPTAYTFLHRVGKAPQRVMINRAAAFPVSQAHGIDANAAAGSVLVEPASRQLLVVAGLPGPARGIVVEIHELQLAGKRRMSSAEFLRGHTQGPGDRFGPEAVV